MPDGLVHGTALIGAEGWVKERVAAFAEAGVSTLNALPLAHAHADRVDHVRRLVQIAG